MKIFQNNYGPDLPESKQVTLADGINRHEMDALRKAIESWITTTALNSGLWFRAAKEIALISGAGIAGLAASFELLAKGYNVIIAEKRKAFERFNVINLDVETQRFLKKFGLLKEFEKDVAGRISTHTLLLNDEKGTQNLGSTDVSKLRPSNVPFEPKFFNDLFKEDGIYSVRIKDLQTYLAKKALEAGVHIFGNVEIKVLDRTRAGGVSKVQITGKDSLSDTKTLQPNLFCIAEGAHSTTAEQLKMVKNDVKNECTGENWIFGDVKYDGKETFVVSLIDTSEGSLEIANIIFNAQIHEINIAVTSKSLLSQELIQERILAIVKWVLSFQNIDEQPKDLIAAVKQPVRINNEQRAIYSRGNVFCIGDTAGHSSPLAGMGGTLGLTLVPRTIEQLVNDSKLQPDMMHHNFRRFTEAYTSRWIAKSQAVKKYCLHFFKSAEHDSKDQEQTSTQKKRAFI